MRIWQDEFSKFQPGVRFENQLAATANAIGALSFNLCDIGLMGREIWQMEDIGYRRLMHASPIEIAVASGSFDIALKTSAFAILVHKDNPLRRISIEQLDAIFGCERRRGAANDLRKWGQLGLGGKWRKLPIRPYGYAINSGLGHFIEQFVMEGSSKWNSDLREYKNVTDASDRILEEAGARMTRDLSSDPAGIAFVPIAYLTSATKALAIRSSGNAAFIPLTRETVADRTYPLARSVYFYVNGTKMDVAVREFLLFVLSRQGREAAFRQSVFLPLPDEFIRAQRMKIDELH